MSDDSIKNDDVSLFLAEMANVTPLKADNRIQARKKPEKLLMPASTDVSDYRLEDVFSDHEIIDDCPDILSFSRSGLQHKLLKTLRQGQQPVEYTLDLHGLTVTQARLALLSFLGQCEADAVRHVLIIHGKGFRSKDKPVIKPMLNRWLRQVDKVLAFHSALPKHGGSGALYVLLKKPSNDDEASLC